MGVAPAGGTWAIVIMEGWGAYQLSRAEPHALANAERKEQELIASYTQVLRGKSKNGAHHTQNPKRKKARTDRIIRVQNESLRGGLRELRELREGMTKS